MARQTARTRVQRMRLSRSPHGRISEVDVLLIRLLADLDIDREWIGRVFGIGARHVAHISLRQSWMHVQ